MGGDVKVRYLCDGFVEACPKTNCYRRGGTCFKTYNIDHAVNFKKWRSGAYSEMTQEEKAKEGFRYETLKPEDIIDLP